MYCQRTTAAAIKTKYQIGCKYSVKVFPKTLILKRAKAAKVKITARKIGINIKSFLTSQVRFCDKISKLEEPGSTTPGRINGWEKRDWSTSGIFLSFSIFPGYAASVFIYKIQV